MIVAGFLFLKMEPLLLVVNIEALFGNTVAWVRVKKVQLRGAPHVHTIFFPDWLFIQVLDSRQIVDIVNGTEILGDED